MCMINWIDLRFDNLCLSNPEESRWDDAILHILDYLSDIDKINFTSACHKFASFRPVIKLDKTVDYHDLSMSSFHKFKKIRYLTNRTSRIPDGITSLVFTDSFNKPFSKSRIPQSVREIKFGQAFNQSIENSIPSHVTHLVFGQNFNQPIGGQLSSKNTHHIHHVKKYLPQVSWSLIWVDIKDQ